MNQSSAARASISVGVVVPTRNAADHVGDTLRSVLAAAPAATDLDVLVVDGASTDDTVAIASSVAGVRVAPQIGDGLAAARNQGVGMVRGDLIAFCDADDRWSAASLAPRLDHLAANPACAAVIGRVEMVALRAEPVPSGQRDRVGAALPGYTPGALLARRSTLEAVGPFTEGLHIGCDSEWFVRLVESGLRCDQLDDIVLFKGVRASSLSTDVDAYRAELLAVARAWLQRRRAAHHA